MNEIVHNQPAPPPAPRQPNTGLVPLTRNWRLAREFSDQEIEHVKRTRDIQNRIQEQAVEQRGNAMLHERAVENANHIALTAQEAFAEVVRRRDALITEAKYERSATDILDFMDTYLAPNLGAVTANAIQKQKR